MGQGDVMKVLKRKNRWLTAKEILTILKAINYTSINTSLKKLYEQGAVLRKEIKNYLGHNTYEYKIK